MKSITKRKPTITAPANDPQSAWATRSEIWRSRVEQLRKMVLSNDPQQRETHLFFRGDADLPERIILLDCSGSISYDVLSWLNEQNVSLIRLNWQGDIVCVTGASVYSANSFGF